MRPHARKTFIRTPEPRLDWRDDAVCRTHPDPELWFPIGDEGPAVKQAEQAKRICKRTCPVVADCLHEALTTQSAGIWGGMDESERRAWALGADERELEATA